MRHQLTLIVISLLLILLAACSESAAPAENPLIGAETAADISLGDNGLSAQGLIWGYLHDIKFFDDRHDDTHFIASKVLERKYPYYEPNLKEHYTPNHYLGRVRPPYTYGLRTIYECISSYDKFLSADPGCEGKPRVRAVFSLYKENYGGTALLYRCVDISNGDHFQSRSSDCGGHQYEGILGYVNTGG